MIRTPRVDECPMSPSNRLAVVILVRDTTNSLFLDKHKAPAEATPKASQALSDDESSTAFARMTSADYDKLKQELSKCFHEAYIKVLRGSSSGNVGYISQLAVEVYFSLSFYYGTCNFSLSLLDCLAYSLYLRLFSSQHHYCGLS